MLRKDLHEANRLAWNEATKAHNSHKADQARFFLQDGNTLFPEEKELLHDIAGLSVAHLLCNSGQDTLSLAQLGAHVTGVDISDTAIDFASTLAKQSGIAATFQRMDVYDWLKETAHNGPHFDIVYCGYGVMWWLSDLSVWAHGVAQVLKPGGRCVIMDFHPVALMFTWQWTLKYPYFHKGQPILRKSGVGDYVARCKALAHSGYSEGITNFQNPYQCYQFIWGLGEVITALLEAGLTLTVLKEYPYFNGCSLFEDMLENHEKRIYPPERIPSLPLMYGICAQKA